MLQTFCRKDALCTDNHRYAGWNPGLCNTRHLSKLSVLHWPLPGATQKVCLVKGWSLGLLASFFGLSSLCCDSCVAVYGNMTWAQHGKCGMQNQGCRVIRIPGMQSGLCHAHLNYAQSRIWKSWPIISLSTSSLSSCAVIHSVSCSKGFSLFCPQSFIEIQLEACGVHNLSCCDLPKLPALGRTDILWLSKFHNAEWEDAVLSISILHIQIFPLGSFLSRRRKFCSRIRNRELSKAERGKQLVTKFFQYLSEKQSSV